MRVRTRDYTVYRYNETRASHKGRVTWYPARAVIAIQPAYTANISNVIFPLFPHVPHSTVIPMYYLCLIAAPSTVE